jgi:hypothetical protein
MHFYVKVKMIMAASIAPHNLTIELVVLWSRKTDGKRFSGSAVQMRKLEVPL